LLIHELNMLRVERKTLQRQVKDLLLRVRQAEQKTVPALEDQGTPTAAKAITSSTSDPSIPQLTDLIGRMPDGSGLPRETRRPLSGKAFPASRRAAASSSNNWPARTTWQHAGGDKKQRPDSHVAPEDRRKMQQLLAKADLNQQQIEMQALENKILKDQVQKLETTFTGTGAVGARHVAGAAHKAVRQAR